MEIGGQDSNLFLKEGAGRDILFFRGVPGGDNIAVAKMEAGATNKDFSWFVRGALILRVFQYTNGC